MCADRANEKKPRSDELAFNLHTNCACFSIAADLTFIKYERTASSSCIRNGYCMRNSPRKRREIKNARKELPHSTMQCNRPLPCADFQTRVLDFHFLLRRAARLIVLRNRLLELFYLIGSGQALGNVREITVTFNCGLSACRWYFFVVVRKFKRLWGILRVITARRICGPVFSLRT